MPNSRRSVGSAAVWLLLFAHRQRSSANNGVESRARKSRTEWQTPGVGYLRNRENVDMDLLANVKAAKCEELGPRAVV